MFGEALQYVCEGSNISRLATGNASGHVGFAGGPQTFASGTGERFGIEGPDMRWARDMARRARSGTPVTKGDKRTANKNREALQDKFARVVEGIHAELKKRQEAPSTIARQEELTALAGD